MKARKETNFIKKFFCTDSMKGSKSLNDIKMEGRMLCASASTIQRNKTLNSNAKENTNRKYYFCGQPRQRKKAIIQGKFRILENPKGQYIHAMCAD